MPAPKLIILGVSLAYSENTATECECIGLIRMLYRSHYVTFKLKICFRAIRFTSRLYLTFL